MTRPNESASPCAWRFYQARFTGQPVAECETCRRVCVYWEEPEELYAGCEHVAEVEA